MDDGARVDLFGVECNTDVPDVDGCIWSVEPIDGWDGADQRNAFIDITGGDGSAAGRSYSKGRALGISGAVDAPSLDAAWAAFNRIQAAMPGLNGSGDVVVYESLPKSLTVRRLGPPRITPPLNRGLTFSLDLLAQYPWKRALSAATVTVGGGATVSHTAAGTEAAEIEVTVTSAGTVDLTIGGLRLRTGSLPSGAVLTSGAGFANPKRTILSSTGGNLFGAIVQPMQWPAMVPGVNSIHQAGTASLSIRYFPTYA